ncbi:MAG: Tm-1-like ATP-binding domain-containing protein [Chloroflexi bacterium]|nr:Tm-1-like ATP-binding domain-containing protein [Chloroflexota bacterium]
MSIVVIGSLDTKGLEVAYIRDLIQHAGQSTTVLDSGTLGAAPIAADFDRAQVALAGGESLANLLASGDKARCQNTMTAGLVNVVSRLYAQGQVDAVIAVGGAQGTAMATAAMRALPVGIPKVMVSTVACGKATFGPYVGTKDVAMIHSVADILGLNIVTRKILAQAAAAVVAMASVRIPAQEQKELIAITQAGVTTPGVMAIKERLEKLGFEIIAFHCNGIGGQAMEELMLDGQVKGVIDFSPHEVTDLLYDGMMPAQLGRLTVAGKVGIPQIVAPGCADIRLHEWREDWSPDLCGRPYVRHSPTHTHFRTTAAEMSAVAHFIAERLNAGKGPRAAIIPLQGFSMFNRPGAVLFDAAANAGYIDTLRAELAPEVKRVEVDAHINDEKFADATVQLFLELRSVYRRN